MSNLTGSRSNFRENNNFQIDQIKELYDIPTSKRTLVSEYHALLSKDSLTEQDVERMNTLQNELSEYMITAEKWNFFGDVIINIQKFFKSNVGDVVTRIKNEMTQLLTNTKQEITEFVTGKKQEVTTYADQKKDEVNSFVTSESGKITKLVGDKSNEITQLVSSKTDEINVLVQNKTRDVNSYVDLRKQEVTQFVTEKTDGLTNTIAQKEQQFNLEMSKMADKGEYNPSTQYHTKNIIRFEGEVYMCIKDALGKHPTNTTHWVKLTIKGDTGRGVGLNPKGVYSASTNYVVNDLVQYNGNVFYAIKASKAIFPSNSEYWALFLSGNGEQLSNLQTEDKFSLVGAINENNQLIKANKQTYDDYVVSNNQKIQQVETSITTNRSQLKKEIQDEFNPKVNGKANVAHTHQTADIIGIDNRINEAVNANSILEKIKTVDGANSGLDADLLGGVSHNQYVRKDGNKVLSDNNYTTTEKNKLRDLPTNSALNTSLSGKVDKVEGKGLSTHDLTTPLNTLLNNLKAYDVGLFDNDGLGVLYSFITSYVSVERFFKNMEDVIGSGYAHLSHRVIDNFLSLILTNAVIPNVKSEEVKVGSNWQTTYKNTSDKILAIKVEKPKNSLGEYITEVTFYNTKNNQSQKVTIKDKKSSNNTWIREVTR